MKERILKAAHLIDTNVSEYSCVALIYAGVPHALQVEYIGLFVPEPVVCTGFLTQLIERGCATKEWRILALCLFAAMQESS
jgi:hypothetical protein